MPDRFFDENDENQHIQHLKINKPDFDVKETITSKTLSTHEDVKVQINGTPKDRRQSINLLKLGTKTTLQKENSFKTREPTSPLIDSKRNLKKA